MIIIDTTLLFAKFAEDDSKHELATSIFVEIFNRKYGIPILIDYVWNELMTLIYIRTKNFELCKQSDRLLREYVDKQAFGFMHTPNEVFWRANRRFMDQNIKDNQRFLSFTDAVIGEMAIWLESEHIGSFDGQFHQFEKNVIG
ncbi:MAG: hypothetical protein INQ03_07890 [Candidatus Heimdallarchaeota archaeon]|nr:hypothetical protein [Candidatus Heimdallarchaeota archaeon]